MNQRFALVADDDAAIRLMISNALSGAGFTVWLAAIGRKLLTFARTIPSDIIITDCSMPQMGGLEAVCQIRGDRTIAPALPIIGTSTMEYSDECLRAGMTEFIRKPFSMIDLVAMVKHCLHD